MDEIKQISINDKEYPSRLKEIKDAPKILYYRGEILERENCFAVVGARLCSSYGKEVALEISGDLAEAGLTVVSGLAPGIDTVSHQATMERGGRTTAVLGTGIDEKSIYPKDNIGLANKIIETGGCVISEYPPGTSGSKITFPKRNRIISGLSLGTLVVEAKSRSGALITADWARKQGRKIFAVPGSIHSLNSEGCHYLIKRGAKLVENVEDILKELKIPRSKTEPRRSRGEGEDEDAVLIANSPTNNEENLILESLREGAQDTEKIIETTKLSASIVARNLAVLEIKGKVRNLGENTYAISNR